MEIGSSLLVSSGHEEEVHTPRLCVAGRGHCWRAQCLPGLSELCRLLLLVSSYRNTICLDDFEGRVYLKLGPPSLADPWPLEECSLDAFSYSAVVF